VDTGASSIALTQEDARAAGVDFSPEKFQIVGSGASGEVTGQFVTIHHIALGQKEAWDLKSVVLKDGLGISLLGQSFLEQISSVSISRDQMTLK
jgi:aspartyl protease family protein